MRIAVISVHGCPCIQPGGTDAGGMNVYVHQVAKRMAWLGNTVRVYSRWHPDMDGSTKRSYDLVHLQVGDLETPKAELPSLLPDFVDAVDEDLACGNQAFDLLASHYWLSGVVASDLARSWSVPHVVSFHTIAGIKKRVRPEEDEPEIRFAEEQRVASEADVVVAWTDGEAQFLRSDMGVAGSNIWVVAPGVDTDLFRRPPEPQFDVGTKRILYVGRLDALKGVDLLVDAFATLVERGVDAELQIVGGGTADEFRRVLSRISELRLSERVKMPGVLSQTELPAVYSAADCIVAPSFHETFGLAVLEAASCGTPAVVADVDGLRSIVVEGETGYLISERDPNLYADKIVVIVQDDDLRNKMSDAARKRAEQLSWDATVDQLIDIYNRITELRGAAAPLR